MQFKFPQPTSHHHRHRHHQRRAAAVSCEGISEQLFKMTTLAWLELCRFGLIWTKMLYYVLLVLTLQIYHTLSE